MNTLIQAETYKLLSGALEQKDFDSFMTNFVHCQLTQDQLSLLKSKAIRVGCGLEFLDQIQKKLILAPFKSTQSKQIYKPEPKDQRSRPVTNRNGSKNIKIEVIGYSTKKLWYCIFDHCSLKKSKKMRVTPYLVVPGYTCPKCKAIYINYQNLPPRGRNPGYSFYIRDIQKIVSSLNPPKEPKTNPVLKPEKNFLMFYSPELPSVCFCKSTHFKQTDKFSYSQTTEKFSGAYCTNCKKCFITTKTYESLSSVTKNLIDFKPSSLSKVPIVPLSFPRALFWWEKEIPVQDTETPSVFSAFIGTGKQILQVTFGIDFGASTTKVVIRSKLGMNKPSWRALVFGPHFTCEDDSEKTLAKSQVYISDTGRIALGKEGVPGWIARPYFKAVLVDQKNHTQDLDEVYYAIYFIAIILKTIEGHVNKSYPPAMYTSLEVKIAMGMPIRGTKERLATVFHNILYIADELKTSKTILLSDGVDFESWKTLCKESHGLQKNHKPYLLPRPELYSEVVGLYNSSYGPTTRALVIDIGSATLDIAYVYTVSPIQPYIYIPIAEVAPLGVEVAASRLVSTNSTIFTTLQDAREYLMKCPKRRFEDKDLAKVVQQLLASCMPKIQRVEHEVFGKARVQPTIPIYFYGGGRDAKWFKAVVGTAIRSQEEGLAFTMPKMQIETIPRVPDQLHHRFQVALGLSNCGEEKLPLRSLPKDHKFLWSELPFTEQKKYIDLEELQKNLYGG